MKRLSFSLLAIIILSFVIVQSCSTEEEESVAPVVQTPQPEPEPEPEPVEYTLTVSAADGGTVSTEGGTYDEGTDVTITASANEGYRFTGWEGNSSTSESLTITLNSNQTYQAIFELIPIYTLTVTTGEGGTVSTEGGEFEEGTELELTATPNEGYRFDGWEGIDSNESTITLTVTSDTELSPIFTEVILPPNPNDISLRQYWGEIVEFEPEFFFADNITSFKRNGILNSNKIITEYFGNYGPTEWWITNSSSSVEDINKLRQQFCQRRLDRNENWTYPNEPNADYDSCMSYGWFEFPDNFLANGVWEIGYNLVVLDESEIGSIYKNYEFNIQLHEYFHVVQVNTILPKSTNEGGDWGYYIPSFFNEGSARFYQEYVFRKLALEGVNIDIQGSLNYQNEPMKNTFRRMREDLQNCWEEFPDFYNIDYDSINTCNPYVIGAWGVAFLMSKKGDGDYDSFWKSFYPLIKDKLIENNNNFRTTFSQAMKEFYGLTLEEFNEEFKLFLQLPIEEQLEIIPDI